MEKLMPTRDRKVKRVRERPSGWSTRTVPDFGKIPPSDRECVKIGLATVRRDGKLSYDWKLIRELWLVDPSATLTEFSIKYQITYNHLAKQGRLSLDRKKAVNAIIRQGYVLQTLRKLIVQAAVENQGAAEQLTRIIGNAAVFAESAAIYARVLMIKLDPQGNEAVNVDAKPQTVKHYSSIMRDVVEMVRGLSEIRFNLGLDDERRRPIDEIVIEPPKTPSEGARTKAKGCKVDQAPESAPDPMRGVEP